MLRRWVTRPVSELGYLVAGLGTGIVSASLTVTLLALSVGLLPAFLLGVPVAAATIYVVHGLAVMERHRASVFLDLELEGRAVRPMRSEGWVRRLRVRVRSAEFWKEVAHGVLLLPLAAASFSLVVGFWSAAFAGLLLPLYVDRLPGDDAVTWLDWSPGLETAAAVVAGLLLLARLLSAALTGAQVALAEALLAPSASGVLRVQVTRLRETRARVVDAADAERRRIERDLHDGAQQQLVALAINLGRAKEKLQSDPAGAARLVTEAHEEAKDSISALRDVVRGVHPAVLTDRGLDAALSALAARSPVPVRLDVDIRQRPSAPPSRQWPTSWRASPSPTSPGTPWRRAPRCTSNAPASWPASA